MKAKAFAIILVTLVLLALGSCALPASLVSTTGGTAEQPGTVPPVTTAPSGTTSPATTTAPGVTTEPTVTTAPGTTTEPTTTAPGSNTDPLPESVSVTFRSDVPVRPFYDHRFLAADFVTEVTATFPRGTYVSEITYAFMDTDDVNRKHYDVLSLRYHTAEGDLISKGAQLTEDTTVFIETELYYHYDVYFANQDWETFYAPLGSSISTVLADSRKGDLNDLLSSYASSGYINLPIFYTSESRDASDEVTTFTEDFTTLWTGIKEAPRLNLICVEGCEGPHGDGNFLWNGYMDSSLLSGHGYSGELGSVEITFYTDPECTIPYTESTDSPIYYTEDVTLYGKAVNASPGLPSAPADHTTLFLYCPICNTFVDGFASSGASLGSVIEGALATCCNASLADYRWYTYDGTGMTYYFSETELASLPTLTELTVWGEPIAPPAGGGGTLPDPPANEYTVTIHCSCRSCMYSGGITRVSVPAGTTVGEMETMHEHGMMILAFTYYSDSAFTRAVNRTDAITSSCTLYAYHSDMGQEGYVTLSVFCRICEGTFPLPVSAGTYLGAALDSLLHECAGAYYLNSDGTAPIDSSVMITTDITVYCVAMSASSSHLRVHCYYCDAESPTIVNDGTKTIGELMSEYCSCDAPREYYLYDPSIGDYVGGFTEDSTVPPEYTELANDPIFSITVYCTCGTEPHINTANVRKKSTVSELLMNYADSVHPTAEYSIRFYVDEARTERPVEELEGYLREDLVFYATCAPEEDPIPIPS